MNREIIDQLSLCFLIFEWFWNWCSCLSTLWPVCLYGQVNYDGELHKHPQLEADLAAVRDLYGHHAVSLRYLTILFSWCWCENILKLLQMKRFFFFTKKLKTLNSKCKHFISSEKKYWNCDFLLKSPTTIEVFYGKRHRKQSFFSVLALLTHSRTFSAWARSHNPHVASSPICHLGKCSVINWRTVCESLSGFSLITGL